MCVRERGRGEGKERESTRERERENERTERQCRLVTDLAEVRRARRDISIDSQIDGDR